MERFINLIKEANKICILGHIRPDGDCVGSCLGLYNYIRDNYKDKEVVVYLEEIPAKFKFLVGVRFVRHEVDGQVYDLAISLDCGATDRHGDFSKYFTTATKTACLDHHKSNEGFGDYYYCDPNASSASEVLCRHLDMDKISHNAAEALYLGIIHDTGVLKYPSTTNETMKCAGKLMEKGVRTQFIIDETFYMVSYKQNLLTGRALLDSKLYLDGKVILSYITKETFEEFKAGKSETEGIIDKLRVTDGVEVAVFIYELNKNVYKCSMRSVAYVDVSDISIAFGGGGHARAAGFETVGSLEDVIDKIIGMIGERI